MPKELPPSTDTVELLIVVDLSVVVAVDPSVNLIVESVSSIPTIDYER